MKFYSNTRPRKCRYTSLFARSTIAFSSFEYGGAILNFCVEPNRIVKLLEELLESRGHKLIFPPKFHCELNFIEMIWGYIKAILRKDCSFNFNDLVLNLPRHLDSVSLPFSSKERPVTVCDL